MEQSSVNSSQMLEDISESKLMEVKKTLNFYFYKKYFYEKTS
jgi:hypothetical protein